MKYYLCVGINEYPGNALAGCVNDAEDWAEALKGRGFGDGKILTDGQATRSNIIGALSDVLLKATRGDTVVFTYSGHGTWVPDISGDEEDGRDEALVPVDYLMRPPQGGQWNLITDDDLYAVTEHLRKPGTRLLIVSDSCHSGTVSRFIGSNGHLERRMVNEALDNPVVTPHGGLKGIPRARFLPPERALPMSSHAAARKVETSAPAGRPRTGAALLSGCADDEVSWDAVFNDRPNGAFTRAALDSLKRDKPGTLAAWHTAIQRRITHQQTPGLSGTWWQTHMTRWV